MALSARDLYFAVRVEDRATRPLRRIAADFRNLGKAGIAARQRDLSQAKLAQQRAASSRRMAEAELATMKTGSGAYGLELRRAKLAQNRAMSVLAEKRALVGVRREVEAVVNAELKASKLSRLPARSPVFKGLSSREVAAMRENALAAAATQRRSLELAGEKAGLAPGAVNSAILAQKQLIAVEAERIAREAELRSIILSRAEAERLATERVAQASIAVQRFPMDKLAGAGRIIGHIGRGLAVIGGIGALAFGALGKSAADFSTQVTLAATQSTTLGNNTVAQVQKNSKFIQAEIQKILASGQVISGPQDQTSAIYRIFSGVTLRGNQLSQLRQGIALLKEFNRVTTANMGLVTLEESTRAGIILINRFGYTAANIRGGLNIMQSAVRFGDLTLSEFIGTLSQAAPAAQAAGFNLTDMSAAVAFLSRQFPNLRQGTTGYARLLEVFSRKDIVQGLKQHGVAITSMAGGYEHLLPIQVIAQNIIDKFGGSVTKGTVFVQNFFKEIGKTQGTIQARKVLESYLHRLGLATTILRQVRRDHNELQKSFDAAQQAPGIRWTEFTIQLKALALEIGAGVIPAVASLADEVRGLANWFNNLSPHTKQMIGQLGLFISVGTLLFGVLGIIIGGITQLAGAIGGILGTRGLAAMAAEGGFVSIQFAALLGVAGALILLFYKYPPALEKIIDLLGGVRAAAEIMIAVLVARRLGLFSAIIAEAIAATGAVTALSTALATLGAIGVVLVTIVVIRKLINQDGSPFKGGLGVETQSFLSDLKQSIRHPLDFHAEVSVFADVGKILWTHDPNAQIEHDLREKIKSLGPVQVQSVDVAITESPRGDITRAADRLRALNDLNKRAAQSAKSLGVAPTPQFRQMFAEFINASRELERLKAAKAGVMQIFEAETRKAAASDALEAYSKAALKAANDILKIGKRFTDQQIVEEARRVQGLLKAAEKAKTFAAWKTYYAALKKLQKDATDTQMQAAQQMFDTTTSKAKDSTDKLKDIYKDVFSTLKNSFDSFLSQNQSAFGQLFQGPFMQSAGMRDSLDWNYQLKTGDLLKDLRQQVGAFKHWRRDIDTLRRKGVPQSLLDEIMKLGPEQAGQQIQLLKKMTPAQLKEYKQLWITGQKEIHRATMQDLRRQLDGWRRHGKQIALAIARGLRDENVALESALKDMIRKAFPSLVKGGKDNAKPTTTTNQRHTGGTTATHSGTDRQNQPVNKNEHVHYHITTTGTKEDVKKQAKDAHWHHRTRYKR